MTPPLVHTTVVRSLIRIPGNGSDASRPPLGLNLIRTLTDTGGLPALDVGLIAENQASGRGALVPIGRTFDSESRPSIGTSRTTEEQNTMTTGAGSLRAPKRSHEISDESRPKKRQRRSDMTDGVAVVQKRLDVQAIIVSRSPSRTGSEHTGPPDEEPNLRISDGGRSPKLVLKPKTAFYQLRKAIEEMERKQEESELEKQKLQEEVDLLHKKLKTFREIFQNTAKLKAILDRLGIKL